MRSHGPRQQLRLPFGGFPHCEDPQESAVLCLALQLRRPPASTDFLPKIDATPSACFYYRFQLARGLSAEVLRQVM
jgi:hypothetical protein